MLYILHFLFLVHILTNMASIYSYGLSLIEKEILTCLIYDTSDMTFQSIKKLLLKVIPLASTILEMSEIADVKDEIFNSLRVKSNWYLYFIIYRLKDNREIRFIKRQFSSRVLNLRYRFVLVDIVLRRYYDPQDGELEQYIEEEIMLKGVHWHNTYENAFEDGSGINLSKDNHLIFSDREDHFVSRTSFIMVESLCSCQMTSCLQDDAMLEVDCIHTFKHDRPRPITHYDLACGKIISYVSCSRFAKIKKVLLVNHPHHIYCKGVKYHVYYLPRSDVWFYCKTASMDEAFEMWDFGRRFAGKYDRIYC